MRFYRRARALITPALRYSQEAYEAAIDSTLTAGSDWLDLGCGHQILPPWRYESEVALARRARTVVGFDYDLDAMRKHRTITARVRGDISQLPFHAATFDFASANMVFEHLKDPANQLAELHRILRPGGVLVFHTPNEYGYGVVLGRAAPDWLKIKLAWWLQGREAEDVYPTYYRINSEAAIEQMAARAGFRVRDVQLVVSTPTLAPIPPLVVFELLWLRALMTKPLRSLRTNIVAVLEKPS
jgi:SAM-dependent methyltransferase